MGAIGNRLATGHGAESADSKGCVFFLASTMGTNCSGNPSPDHGVLRGLERDQINLLCSRAALDSISNCVELISLNDNLQIEAAHFGWDG